MTARVVTIHARIGAGGGVVGPKVAEALGLPFMDRAIPAAVARSLAVPLADALAHDERAETGLGRILAAMTPMGPLGMLPEGAIQGVVTEKAYREQSERLMREMAETTGGVILGRAGMLVLADFPGALHVSLTGSAEARIRQAVAIGMDTEENVRTLIADTDRANKAYYRYFYRVDATESKHYDMLIDSTKVPLDACTEMILTAARAIPGE